MAHTSWRASSDVVMIISSQLGQRSSITSKSSILHSSGRAELKTPCRWASRGNWRSLPLHTSFDVQPLLHFKSKTHSVASWFADKRRSAPLRHLSTSSCESLSTVPSACTTPFTRASRSIREHSYRAEGMIDGVLVRRARFTAVMASAGLTAAAFVQASKVSGKKSLMRARAPERRSSILYLCARRARDATRGNGARSCRIRYLQSNGM